MTEHHECIERLVHAGFVYEDACALRRIAMTLHRWHELECGDGNEFSSWSIARGEWKNGAFEYDDNGRAYLERHLHRGDCKTTYNLIADRERGAQKRLAKIMARYPSLSAYVQGDPRGAALYILPPDVTAENYNRGIAVYR